MQAQFLDEDHLLLGLGAPDAVSVRGSDAHAVHSFLFIVRLSTGKVCLHDAWAGHAAGIWLGVQPLKHVVCHINLSSALCSRRAC